MHASPSTRLPIACRIGRALLVPVVLGCLSGCASQTALSTPATTLPATFDATPPTNGVSPEGLDRWWEEFDDPQLTALIATALQSGTDARLAYARIREARALRDQDFSTTLPTGDLAGSVSAQDSASLPGGKQGAGAGEGHVLAFNPSWEIDLFGRLDATRDKARADFAASLFDYHATLLVLAADVASGLFEARGLAVQRADADVRLRIARDLAQTSELGLRHGLVSGADTARLQSDLAGIQAEKTRLEAALRVSIRSLLVLTGRAGDPVDSLPIDPVLRPPPSVPAVTPGLLLARRPDILSAEQKLRAAAQTVRIDRAELFPRFDLQPGASLTRAAGQGATIGLWSLGIGLHLPILDRPRLMAQLRISQARGEQAVVGYERAVQVAFREADNALTLVDADRSRLVDLGRGAERAEYAFDAARTGYRLGLTDLTTLLQSERSWRAAQASLTQAQTVALTNVVTAYRALGGGWDPVAPEGSALLLSKLR